MTPSLWNLDRLKDYQRKLDSELPPLYDFQQVRTAHREIEADILEYWEMLHPIIADFITSWFQIWGQLGKENANLKKKINEDSLLLRNYQDTSVNKIKNLESEIAHIKSQIETLKENLKQKEAELQKLDEMDHEKQLGISNLRVELEKELAELNLKLSEMQTRYEATQAQVNQSFEEKMWLFESEVKALKDQVKTQEEKLQQLQLENITLKKENKSLDLLEEKIWEINEKLRGLSFKETEE